MSEKNSIDIVVAKVYQGKLKELAVREQMKIPRAGYTGEQPKKKTELAMGRRGYFLEPLGGEALLVTRKH